MLFYQVKESDVKKALKRGRIMLSSAANKSLHKKLEADNKGWFYATLKRTESQYELKYKSKLLYRAIHRYNQWL